ncbi:Cyclin-dependent kinase inhibitor 2A, isoform 4 [Pteropus alecto]|uniref:Cyclin-dependent kinase inhibitor 2A, isoform 4 n=1 Tax=Pteropus alecto TaxID=9402 RepID=L5KYC1_PTEAL|nr:Cyclin-dependent kinase inhibitor 2A, isoform 4 [Pteropus alecto]
MVRTFLVTVRIRRSRGPPQVRAFVVQFPRPAGEWASPGVRAAAALVLTLVRSQRRAQQPHSGGPGRKGLEKSRAQSALRCFCLV